VTSREADRLSLPGSPPTDEDLQHQIELTRDELGDTVAALAYKANVKARAQDKARQTAESAKATVHSAGRTLRRHRTSVTAVGAAGLVSVVIVLILRRR